MTMAKKPDDIVTPDVMAEDEAISSKKSSMMPIEVIILTNEHEIKGIVYVSRKTRDDRRMSELLNNPERRFLAITDAQIVSRTRPSSARQYSFLQVHIDNITMIHPSTQSVANHTAYSRDDALRFDRFREKLGKVVN